MCHVTYVHVFVLWKGLTCSVEVVEKELYEMEFHSTLDSIRFVRYFYGTEKRKLKPRHFLFRHFLNSGT